MNLLSWFKKNAIGFWISLWVRHLTLERKSFRSTDLEKVPGAESRSYHFQLCNFELWFQHIKKKEKDMNWHQRVVQRLNWLINPKPQALCVVHSKGKWTAAFIKEAENCKEAAGFCSWIDDEHWKQFSGEVRWRSGCRWMRAWESGTSECKNYLLLELCCRSSD